jgi:hypothetical protein
MHHPDGMKSGDDTSSRRPAAATSQPGAGHEWGRATGIRSAARISHYHRCSSSTRNAPAPLGPHEGGSPCPVGRLRPCSPRPRGPPRARWRCGHERRHRLHGRRLRDLTAEGRGRDQRLGRDVLPGSVHRHGQLLGADCPAARSGRSGAEAVAGLQHRQREWPVRAGVGTQRARRVPQNLAGCAAPPRRKCRGRARHVRPLRRGGPGARHRHRPVPPAHRRPVRTDRARRGRVWRLLGGARQGRVTHPVRNAAPARRPRGLARPGRHEDTPRRGVRVEDHRDRRPARQCGPLLLPAGPGRRRSRSCLGPAAARTHRLRRLRRPDRPVVPPRRRVRVRVATGQVLRLPGRVRAARLPELPHHPRCHPRRRRCSPERPRIPPQL